MEIISAPSPCGGPLPLGGVLCAAGRPRPPRKAFRRRQEPFPDAELLLRQGKGSLPRKAVLPGPDLGLTDRLYILYLKAFGFSDLDIEAKVD